MLFAKENPLQRRVDSYKPGRYYSKIGKNSWVVDPQQGEKTDTETENGK